MDKHNLADKTSALIDSTASAADHAVRSSQRVANQALDRLAERIDEARVHAGPALGHLASEAERMARRGADVVRRGPQQLRERAHRVTDSTADHVREEPLKALLIAAAAGAALMALLTLARRGRPTRSD